MICFEDVQSKSLLVQDQRTCHHMLDYQYLIFGRENHVEGAKHKKKLNNWEYFLENYDPPGYRYFKSMEGDEEYVLDPREPTSDMKEDDNLFQHANKLLWNMVKKESEPEQRKELD